MSAFRKFWYNNVPGTFEVAGQAITRRQIQIFGGPSPIFAQCRVCQESEWLSRVNQRNLYESHDCPTSERCCYLCERQGHEQWTLYHQNFWYAIGNDDFLSAPKIACWFPKGQGSRLHYRYWNWHCDGWMINLRRQLAQAGQVTVLSSHRGVDWKMYDLVFFMNAVKTPLIPRPPIPLVMYGHDMWGGGFQRRLDHFRPEVLLTPYPTPWRRNFHIPKKTQIHFYPMPASQFFTRPNLGTKDWDLLDTGVAGGPCYAPRRELQKQITGLPDRFTVKHDHRQGHRRGEWKGPVVSGARRSGRRRGEHDGRHYLNAWSRWLGRAQFVTFGPLAGKAKGMLLMKYCEVLGSGAIPIIPDVEDLALLGVKPMVHYIPLREIWRNNKQLIYYLDHYGDHKYIAENAVAWHRKNADRLLFDGFEDVIRGATGRKYPRRLTT